MGVAGAFLFLLLWFGARDTQQVLVLEGRTMGTTWSVQLVLPAHSSPGPDLADAIATRLEQLDRGIFSTYVPDSALMQFNAAEPGRQFPVPDEMARVLTLALDIHDKTGGAFDPTVGPLVRLWGFGADPAAGDVPADADITAALGRVGMEALQFDTRLGALLKSRDVELDLSAIAKGYAVDEIAAMLDGAGLDNFLVEIGGELLARGPGAGGDGWNLAIEVPDPSQRSPMTIVSSHGKTLALAGSGDYRNYRIVDGQRYSHEIDPGTGRPVTHNLAATTVLAVDAATADAWATALMVLGAEKGIPLAELNGIAAYFIMHDGDGFRTNSTTAWRSQF